MIKKTTKKKTTKVVAKTSKPVKKTAVKKPKKVKVSKTIQPKANKKTLEEVRDLTVELLRLMGMAKAKVKLTLEGETIKINIDYADPGILIGNQGETIYSLQLVLSLMVYKKLGYWQRLIVNVADYLEQRTDSLEKLALNTAQRVKFSGKETVMSYLNSAERRIVHLALAESPDVVTESIGEGRDRRLVIKPKKKE